MQQQQPKVDTPSSQTLASPSQTETQQNGPQVTSGASETPTQQMPPKPGSGLSCTGTRNAYRAKENATPVQDDAAFCKCLVLLSLSMIRGLFGFTIFILNKILSFIFSLTSGFWWLTTKKKCKCKLETTIL